MSLTWLLSLGFIPTWTFKGPPPPTPPNSATWPETIELWASYSCSINTSAPVRVWAPEGAGNSRIVGFTGLFYQHLCTRDTIRHKLQALVYNIFPSTTAVFSYAIGSRKLSANEQFFVGAQMVVSLLQTIQIISDICFITDHVAYASLNKTKIVWIEMELSFLPEVDTPHVCVCAWALGCFHSLISTQTFRRVLTMLVDSCTEIKSAPSVA